MGKNRTGVNSGVNAMNRDAHIGVVAKVERPEQGVFTAVVRRDAPVDVERGNCWLLEEHRL